jgi:hypothetical protein
MYVDDLVFAFRREVFYLVREVFCLNFELVTKGGILMQWAACLPICKDDKKIQLSSKFFEFKNEKWTIDNT